MNTPDSDLPTVVVLLAVYNGMNYLPQQVASILDQQHVKVTIFASIDISSDNSKEWLEQLAQQDSRVKILPYGQHFGGAARNFFRLLRDVDLSNFSYVAFADQDDVWHVDKLKRATTLLANSSFDAYSSNVTAFWPNGRELLIDKAQAQKRFDYFFEAAGPGCTYVLSPKLVDALKTHMLTVWEPLQQVTMHDWYCYAFARSNDYQWFIDKEPSMRYRQHANNQIGVNINLKARLNRIKLIKDGWWLSQARLIAKLTGAAHTPFVQSWSALNRAALLRLASKALQCRRRPKEQVVFFVACLLLAIKA